VLQNWKPISRKVITWLKSEKFLLWDFNTFRLRNFCSRFWKSHRIGDILSELVSDKESRIDFERVYCFFLVAKKTIFSHFFPPGSLSCFSPTKKNLPREKLILCKNFPRGRLFSECRTNVTKQCFLQVIVQWKMTSQISNKLFYFFHYKSCQNSVLLGGLAHVVGVETNLSKKKKKGEQTSNYTCINLETRTIP